MGTGSARDRPSRVLTDREHSVVVLHANREQARLLGSVTGPTVLAPGPEQGWQVLATLPGAPPGNGIATAARFGMGQLGMDEPFALSLHRTGSTRWLAVPVSPERALMRTWAAELRRTDLEEGLFDEIARHLVTMAPDASLHDVLETLRDDRTDGQPLAELVTVLGLPPGAVDALEDPEALDGQLLVRADIKRHRRDLVRSRVAEMGPVEPLDTSAMRFGPEAMTRASDRVFGVVWGVLGVLMAMVGTTCLALGLRPAGTVVGVSHPAGWVGLGVVLTWLGHRQWRRSQKL